MEGSPITSEALARYWREETVSVAADVLASITASADLTLSPVRLSATGEVADPDPAILAPELMVGVSLIVSGSQTGEGALVTAVTPMWMAFLDELAERPAAFGLLDPRQTEELIAGAYERDRWRVTLTPRSGDGGRDIIAYRDDVGAIRVLDQVKRYAPGHLVTADEVRALFGVLNLDPKASKAYVTTTSAFAPGVAREFASVMPTRLELRDGNDLRAWLNRIRERRR